jgi:hypothetical protein
MIVIARIVFRCVPIAALMIAAMNVPCAQAQGRHHGARSVGMSHGVAPLFVLGHEAVQKELALTPEQTDKVKQLVADVHEEWSQQVQAAGGGSRGNRDQSREDRQKRFTEMRSKYAAITKNVNDKYRGRLAEILDKPQQTRLRGIAIQVAGIQAFNDADVARDLGLTKTQHDQIAAVHQEYADKFAQLRSEGRQRQSGEGLTKMHELRQEELAKSTNVLTPPQQEAFATMKGKPFDFAQLHETHRHHGDHTKSGRSA